MSFLQVSVVSGFYAVDKSTFTALLNCAGVGQQNQISSKLPIFVPLPFDYFVSNPSATACTKCSSTISAQWSQTIA